MGGIAAYEDDGESQPQQANGADHRHGAEELPSLPGLRLPVQQAVQNDCGDDESAIIVAERGADARDNQQPVPAAPVSMDRERGKKRNEGIHARILRPLDMEWGQRDQEQGQRCGAAATAQSLRQAVDHCKGHQAAEGGLGADGDFADARQAHPGPEEPVM